MQRQKLTIHDRQYRGSGLQRQNLTINFDQKSRTQATFTYKQGEIDKNGIEVELTNVDVVNATGQVRVKDPEGNFLEPGMVTVIGSKANFILPTYAPGTWEFELRIFNDNGTAISSTYAYTVMESFNTDDTTVEVYESLWDTWTKDFVSWSDAERTREANESGRIIEHSERIETVDKAINDAKSATVSATAATQATLDAIDDATQATQATLDAIDDATQATQATLDAIDDASTATTSAIKATSDANSATTKATTATTNADNATNAANTATANANKATADANSATQSVNNAISAGTVDLETKQARTDYNGVEHANLKTRLDNDFETLASLIPTDIAFDGYESVTTNDTLSGDVKNTTLTGQTLVNIAPFTNSENATNGKIVPCPLFKLGSTITICYNVEKNTSTKDESFNFMGYAGGSHVANTNLRIPKSIGLHVSKTTLTTSHNTDNYRLRIFPVPDGEFKISNIVILEGDHTDKPLEFFEGLKSSEVSEIGTHGVNLVGNSKNLFGTGMNDGGVISTTGAHVNRTLTDFISVSDAKTYTTYGSAGTFFNFYDDNKACINPTRVNVANNRPFSIPSGSKFARFFVGDPKSTTMYLYEVTGSEPSTYVPYTSSKTTLSEPITLRSLPNGVADTYDVDTGVLTRRCGEVVLNGSDVADNNREDDLTKSYIIRTDTDHAMISLGVVSDRFKTENHTNGSEGIRLSTVTKGSIIVNIAKSKLPTPDVAGFKTWLAENPTTVVYQLAEPTTEYIENNGQLRSYATQTTVTADSIVPVKLNGNIPVNYASTLNTLSTVARELKLENVALIEQAETLEQQLIVANETNDYQDSLIDVSLLATDELYTLIEPLLPEFAKLETKGGNAMVDAYVAMVIKGLKTIDQVPARYREEVKRVLAELEK